LAFVRRDGTPAWNFAKTAGGHSQRIASSGFNQRLSFGNTLTGFRESRPTVVELTPRGAFMNLRCTFD
jgi:hypothetical protein